MRSRRIIGLAAIALAALAVFRINGCAAETRPSPAQHPAIPAGKTCAECHAKDKTHLPPYDGACDECHQLNSWRIVIYEHESADLDMGIHGVMGCVRCHTEGSPVVPKTCPSCHSAKHGGWTECRQCHLPLTWRDRKPAPLGHLSLAGGHSKVSCLGCHTLAQTPVPPRTCSSCHGTKHGGITGCERCHDPATGWTALDFDHSVFFRLSGVHTRLACSRCHTGGRFAGTPTGCVSCHGDRHSGLRTCARCHTTSRWKPSTFRHSRVFPLSPGPHAQLACSRCHPSGKFGRVTGRTCVGCHGTVHGVSTCTSCHARSGALASSWDHSVFFRLVGAHTSLACSACHGSPRRPAPGTRCVDCHGTRHGGLTDCAACHSTSSFSPIQAIAHPRGIPIGGHHGSLSGCSECHRVPLDFVSPPRACVECHAGDVPHVGPSDCLRCHYPVASWATLHFTHPSVTPHSANQFPCDFCHDNHDFTRPRGAICVTCHPPF